MPDEDRQVIDELHLENLDKRLKEVCKFDPKIDKTLHKLPAKDLPKNITCDFLLIKSTEQKVREEDFIKMLLGAMVRYTLSYLKRHPYNKNDPGSKIDDFVEDNMVDLVHEAKGLLIHKLTKTTSEFGELFLFMLLESKGIVQLLNKMNLKTNGDIPINGLDAIHIFVHEGSLVFYYGYSKVEADPTDAIRDAVEEAKIFAEDLKRQEREYDLINDYIDKGKFAEFSEQIINIISPYASDKSIVAEGHSMFLGYHWALLDNPTCPPSMKLDDFLKESYNDKIPKMTISLKDHIEKKFPNWEKYPFIVWMLPLSDLDKFREKFMKILNSY